MHVTKITKQDKQMLHDEFAKAWNKGSDMPDWCVRTTSAYMTVGDRLVTFDKPRIETRFCFGYGRQGAYDYDEVQEVCDSLSRNERYFVDHNLERSDAGQDMRAIEDSFWIEWWLSDRHYTGQTPDCRLGSVFAKHREDHDWCERQGWRLLTEDELHEYYRVCFEEQVKLCKRLKTYLKRYGLSKCEYWTYWADE